MGCKQLIFLIKILSSGTDDYRSGGEIRPLQNGTTCETSKILNT
jgi:hypothetical protein